MRSRLAVLVAFVLVLLLPMLVRALSASGAEAASARDLGARKLVIVTPHVEQIRSEFGEAFSRWHERNHGEGVYIDWRTPGGTSEIMKQLEAQAEASARQGLLKPDGAFEPGSAGSDLFFGGGSYEHGKMKSDRTINVRGQAVTYKMGRPAGFSPAQLDEWFGENKIGSQRLYDPDQYWLGTALSGFGIVYNKPVLASLGLREPRSFQDLTDFGYFNMLALADARLSGSIATTYESILNKEGWDRGWRILREISGNARYFASASTKPPIDVGQGECAAGLAIDFYGRGQAQSLIPPGGRPEDSRVGYVNPAGAVFIDADPASILNGAVDPELAQRFIEFCLTEEGQALWQFRATDQGRSIDRLGPRQHELRRMPVRRIMYERYSEFLMDKSNPFEEASELPNRGWRDSIAPMMAAFGVDSAPECRAALKALNRARADPGFPADRAAEMARLFYAMPTHTMADGTRLEFSETNYKAIRDDTKRWKDPTHGRRACIAYTTFFRDNYARIVELYERDSASN